MKKWKWILTGTALVFLIAYAINGTLATDTGGTIDIYSYELQRVNSKDSSTGNDNLEKYKESKMLLPTTSQEVHLADGYQQWDDNGNFSDRLYTETVTNAADQFVFVKNDGTTSAFTRVWFAFEQGGVANEAFDDVVGILKNENTWRWDADKTKYGVEINGNTYVVMCAVYKKTLEANSMTTNPSLLQVLMYNSVSSETAELLDGDKDNTYDILVYTQGMQYVANQNIADLLDATFGKEHPWKNGVVITDTDNRD